MKRRLLQITLALVIAAIAGFALACGDSTLPGGVVAMVGDTQITEEQLDAEVTREATAYGITKETYPDNYDELLQSLRTYVLENLVMNEVATQEAAKLGLTVSDEEVQAKLDEYVSYAEDQAAFEEQLTAEGYTLDGFKQTLREGLLRDKVRQEAIKDVTSVPEEDIAGYYEANRSSYSVEASRELRHILVKPAGSGSEADWQRALATANDVRRKLVAGGDWGALAAQYSGDFATKDTGGDLDTVKQGEQIKEFEDAAFALELDEVSQPVKTVYGYEVIQATVVTVGGEQTLEQVRAQIVAQLLSQAQDEAWNAWIDQKATEIGVVYRDDLKPPETTTTESTPTTVAQPTTT